MRVVWACRRGDDLQLLRRPGVRKMRREILPGHGHARGCVVLFVQEEQ